MTKKPIDDEDHDPVPSSFKPKMVKAFQQMLLAQRVVIEEMEKWLPPGDKRNKQELKMLKAMVLVGKVLERGLRAAKRLP